MSRLYLFHQNRVRVILNGVIFIGLIILIRFFYIQVLNAEGYHESVSKKINFKKKVKGDRGKIYDRNGIALAENITKVTFWTNTNHNIDEKSIASFLYQEFDMPESSIVELINSKNTNYLPFKKDVVLEDLTKTVNKAESIKGLYLDKKTKRFYRYKNACSQLIGHIDYNGEGKSGVELQFNSVLKGNEKIETFYKSRSGRFSNKGKESFNSNLYGNDIHLTIDIQLQNILFEAIKRGYENSNAKSANGIIIDPNSGEILALASIPGFDPNDGHVDDLKKIKNNTISDQYEPGSTLKVISILDAILIEDIKDGMLFDCENGEYNLPGSKVLIHDHEPNQKLSLEEILIYSSNIGIAKLSDIIGEEQIFNSLKKFGLGTKTGIDLPGEERGFLRPLKSWSKVSKAMVSMGQEVSATNLQLSMIYASIANGGYLLKPKIIKKIDDSPNDINLNEVEVIRKVMNKNQSDKILDILTKAVKDGTGTNAIIPGYNVAGKTGTAEKFIDGAYSKEYFVSSFASIFPSDNPRFVCVISVDSPEYHKHWGNMTAAPIVKEIYKQIIINDYLSDNQNNREVI
tara:strand:+ start:18306 stop:20024 length:1719 start_codon:yes stop_codon:yes gene_type:complete